MSRPFTATCPVCGYKADSTSQVPNAADLAEQTEEATAKAGDAAMCINCGKMNIVTDDGVFRRPTDEEAAILAADDRVVQMLLAWAGVRARRQ